MKWKMILLLLGFAPQIFAQGRGGEIFYEYLGNQPGFQDGDYRVYLTVFTDSTGYADTSYQPTLCVFRDTIYDHSVALNHLSSSSPLPSGYRIQPGDPYGWHPSAPYRAGPHGNNWHSPYYGEGCAGTRPVVEVRYTALVHLPSFSPKWRFVHHRPGHRFHKNLDTTSTLSLHARVNHITLYSNNNSLRFNTPANLKFCLDTLGSTEISWKQEIIEPDEDSIHFDFPYYGPLTGDADSCTVAEPVAFRQGLTPGNPLPSATQPRIDPQTGTVSFTPVDTGKFTLVIRARELRPDIDSSLHWFRMGEVIREIPIEIVRGCNSIEAPEQLFSTLHLPSLGFHTYLKKDSSSGDFAGLYWNSLKVDEGLLADSNFQYLQHKPAPGLLPIPYKFALTGSDWCGRQSSLAQAHENIAVDIEPRSAGYHISWTPYQGRAISKYRIYTADTGRQNLSLLDSTSGGQHYLNANFLPPQTEFIVVEGVLSDTGLLPDNYDFAGPLGAIGIDFNAISRPQHQVQNFRLFPNPAKNSLEVHSPLRQSLPYKIMGPAGRLMLSGKLQPGKNSINLLPLDAGMYFFRPGKGEAIRFIKQ